MCHIVLIIGKTFSTGTRKRYVKQVLWLLYYIFKTKINIATESEVFIFILPQSITMNKMYDTTLYFYQKKNIIYFRVIVKQEYLIVKTLQSGNSFSRLIIDLFRKFSVTIKPSKKHFSSFEKNIFVTRNRVMYLPE